MKKKILSLVLAICLIVPCVFMLTACGGLKTGVEYKLKEVSVVWPNDETKELVLGMAEMTEEEFNANISESIDNGLSFTFNEDGTVSATQGGETDEEVMYYTLDGDTITIYDSEEKTEDDIEMSLKVDGSKLIMEQTIELGDTMSYGMKAVFER
ncbi:MAG: hypothetical protein IJA61_04530 [Clostridia bacterium]|nr:hypothetical protein [Clostridia bacterium]